jgi:hypothetical protein
MPCQYNRKEGKKSLPAAFFSYAGAALGASRLTEAPGYQKPIRSPQDFRPLQLGQVRRNNLLDLGLHSGLQLREQLVIDLAAGGQQTSGSTSGNTGFLDPSLRRLTNLAGLS